MKFAEKLMVVPFVKKIEDPIDEHLLNLDDEISRILNNKKLSASEKTKKYNHHLSRFMNKDNEIIQNQKSIIHKVEAVNLIPEEKENEIGFKKKEFDDEMIEERKKIDDLMRINNQVLLKVEELIKDKEDQSKRFYTFGNEENMSFLITHVIIKTKTMIHHF
jgi:hypothetical protein